MKEIPQFSQPSDTEQQEIREAKRQLIQAERRVAESVLRHLKLEHLLKTEDVAILRYPTELSTNSLMVIRCGGNVCGIYVDPPGVCVAVN